MRWRTVLRFNHEGRTMLVKRLGADTGPQFVLVHGIGVASRYYTRLAAVLARSGGVHAVELPGHGGAPKPAKPQSIEDYAAVLSAYVLESGLSDPILVGHSMGGQVVIEAALQHPDTFPRIVLLGSVVNPRERSAVLQGLRLAQDTFLETPASNYAVFRDYARTGPRWYLATVPAMIGYRTDRAAARLTAETLVVRGIHDPIARHHWSQELARLIPRSRLVEVPGGAHVVMYTATDRVAQEVLDHARAGIPSTNLSEPRPGAAA
jgi:pimeloyl-ACP methyl ester carboxylesterase